MSKRYLKNLNVRQEQAVGAMLIRDTCKGLEQRHKKPIATAAIKLQTFYKVII